MTCIIGLKNDDYIHIGYDSALSNSYSMSLLKTKKVFKKEAEFKNNFLRYSQKIEDKNKFEFCVGISGSGRQQNILNYIWNPPKFESICTFDIFSEEEMYEYLCGPFLSSIRKAFKDEGFMKVENNEESYYGYLMIGIFGRIFVVDSELFIVEKMLNYEAIGSGSEVARGSLFSTEHMEDCEERIRIALEAAETFVPSVRKPFHILKVSVKDYWM